MAPSELATPLAVALFLLASNQPLTCASKTDLDLSGLPDYIVRYKEPPAADVLIHADVSEREVGHNTGL